MRQDFRDWFQSFTLRQTHVSNVATFQVPAFVDLSCLFKPGFGHPKSPEVSAWHQPFSHATEAGVQSHLWNCEGLWRKPQEFETLCGGGAARVVLFFCFFFECKLAQICDRAKNHVTRAHHGPPNGSSGHPVRQRFEGHNKTPWFQKRGSRVSCAADLGLCGMEWYGSGGFIYFFSPVKFGDNRTKSKNNIFPWVSGWQSASLAFDGPALDGHTYHRTAKLRATNQSWTVV